MIGNLQSVNYNSTNSIMHKIINLLNISEKVYIYNYQFYALLGYKDICIETNIVENYVEITLKYTKKQKQKKFDVCV